MKKRLITLKTVMPIGITILLSAIGLLVILQHYQIWVATLLPPPPGHGYKSWELTLTIFPGYLLTFMVFIPRFIVAWYSQRYDGLKMHVDYFWLYFNRGVICSVLPIAYVNFLTDGAYFLFLVGLLPLGTLIFAALRTDEKYNKLKMSWLFRLPKGKELSLSGVKSTAWIWTNNGFASALAVTVLVFYEVAVVIL